MAQSSLRSALLLYIYFLLSRWWMTGEGRRGGEARASKLNDCKFRRKRNRRSGDYLVMDDAEAGSVEVTGHFSSRPLCFALLQSSPCCCCCCCSTIKKLQERRGREGKKEQSSGMSFPRKTLEIDTRERRRFAFPGTISRPQWMKREHSTDHNFPEKNSLVIISPDSSFIIVFEILTPSLSTDPPPSPPTPKTK